MDIKSELKKLNYKHPIKIRIDVRSKRLYLEYNSNNKRNYIYPKISMTGDRTRDNQAIKSILKIRTEMEHKITFDNVGIDVFKKSDVKIKLADFASQTIENKPKRTKEFYTSGINSLIRHSGDQFINWYTAERLQKWFYSLEHSQTTKHNYLRAVKYVFKMAVKEKYIKSNPGEDLHCKFPESRREFLTIDEVREIASLKFDKPVIQDAFIFSCYTGLRLGDIRLLKWNNIVKGYLDHKQHKTGHVERAKLHKVALDIISRQPQVNQFIFQLHAQKRFYKNFNRMMGLTKIEKKITFHCARHTFATLLISYGADLYAVSKLLGHMDIQTTQIYAKIIDKKKDEAINLLPDLEIQKQ